jgi:hypothetical protein
VSTWLSASVTQCSGVRGGKSDEESVARSSGILLIKNDRRMVVDWALSLRNVAFARISKAARMRSTIVCWMSP